LHKEIQCQITLLATFHIGGLIENKKVAKIFVTDLIARQCVQANALLGDTTAFTFNTFTFARGKRSEEVIKAFIVSVEPVKLAA